MATHLTSFTAPVRAVVVGATGGIGNAFVHHLLQEPAVEKLYAFGRKPLDIADERCRVGQLDYADEISIAAAAKLCEQPNLIIVATGILHDETMAPEKSLRELNAEKLAQNYLINTIGPALVAKYFLPLLPREERGVFAALSARVGSIGDNRLGGWYGYRAAKAGLNMVLKNAAIEMARRHKQAVIVGLHPGTVDTSLSKPFQGGVKPEKLFAPEHAAQCLLKVINGLAPADSGKCFDWAGEEVVP